MSQLPSVHNGKSWTALDFINMTLKAKQIFHFTLVDGMSGKQNLNNNPYAIGRERSIGNTHRQIFQIEETMLLIGNMKRRQQQQQQHTIDQVAE